MEAVSFLFCITVAILTGWLVYLHGRRRSQDEIALADRNCKSICKRIRREVDEERKRFDEVIGKLRTISAIEHHSSRQFAVTVTFDERMMSMFAVSNAHEYFRWFASEVGMNLERELATMNAATLGRYIDDAAERRKEDRFRRSPFEPILGN